MGKRKKVGIRFNLNSPLIERHALPVGGRLTVRLPYNRHERRGAVKQHRLGLFVEDEKEKDNV